MSTKLIIHAEDPSDLARPTAVLEALGYTVLQDVTGVDIGQRTSEAVSRLKKSHMLTEREAQVLEGVLNAKTPPEIAVRLEVSRHTVKWHLHNIFAKTCARNTEDLVRYAFGLPRRGPST